MLVVDLGGAEPAGSWVVQGSWRCGRACSSASVPSRGGGRLLRSSTSVEVLAPQRQVVRRLQRGLGFVRAVSGSDRVSSRRLRGLSTYFLVLLVIFFSF